jgi:predicted TIM-barrel fold metal-dependent hydrolase
MACSGPVIDTHHHIWLRKDVAWLADPPIPRMFGDYFGIRRDYPVEEFMNDVKPQGVTKSVHVTAMWGPDRALDETRWLQSVADKHGFPHGIVCNVDLSDPGVDAALKTQRQFPNLAPNAVLGQRNCSTGRAPSGFLQFARFPPCVRAAGKHDLHFELQVYAGQVARAVGLIKAFPSVRMILVQAGMLTARTQAAIDQWRAALTMMAAFPNLYVKISGLGMYSSGITLAQARQVIRDVIQIFGVERTIYSSNFPSENCTQAMATFLVSTGPYYRSIPKPRSAPCFTTMRSSFIAFEVSCPAK